MKQKGHVFSKYEFTREDIVRSELVRVDSDSGDIVNVEGLRRRARRNLNYGYSLSFNYVLSEDEIALNKDIEGLESEVKGKNSKNRKKATRKTTKQLKKEEEEELQSGIKPTPKEERTVVFSSGNMGRKRAKKQENKLSMFISTTNSPNVESVIPDIYLKESKDITWIGVVGMVLGIFSLLLSCLIGTFKTVVEEKRRNKAK